MWQATERDALDPGSEVCGPDRHVATSRIENADFGKVAIIS